MKKVILLFVMMVMSLLAIEEEEYDKPIGLEKQKAIFDERMAYYSKHHKTFTFKILATYKYEGIPQPYYLVGASFDEAPDEYIQVTEKTYEDVLEFTTLTENPTIINMIELIDYDSKGNYKD